MEENILQKILILLKGLVIIGKDVFCFIGIISSIQAFLEAFFENSNILKCYKSILGSKIIICMVICGIIIVRFVQILKQKYRIEWKFKKKKIVISPGNILKKKIAL